MANTKIDGMYLTNYDLSHSLKSFFNELVDHEMQFIKGGQQESSGIGCPVFPTVNGTGNSVFPAPTATQSSVFPAPTTTESSVFPATTC